LLTELLEAILCFEQRDTHEDVSAAREVVSAEEVVAAWLLAYAIVYYR